MTPLLLALIPELFSIGASIAKEIASHSKDERNALMLGEAGDGLRGMKLLVDDMLEGREIDLSSYEIPSSFFEKLEAAGHSDVVEAVKKLREERES